EAQKRACMCIPNEWLLARTSVSWVEERHLEELFVLAPSPYFLDFDAIVWEALKEMMTYGDELWTFCSHPHEPKGQMMGTAGVALVRAGKVIGSHATMHFFKTLP